MTGKEVTEEVTDFGRKKVTGKRHRKKSQKHKIFFFFFYFMLEIDIIILIFSTIIKNTLVCVNVLRPDYQFSVMPELSLCFLSTKQVLL